MVCLQNCLALLAIALFAIFHQGESLECYECSTQKDPDCRDNLSPKHLVKCANGHVTTSIIGGDKGPSYDTDYCFIASIKGFGVGNHIMRGCIKKPDNPLFCSTLIPYTVCKFCDKDKCNNGGNQNL